MNQPHHTPHHAHEGAPRDHKSTVNITSTKMPDGKELLTAQTIDVYTPKHVPTRVVTPEQSQTIKALAQKVADSLPLTGEHTANGLPANSSVSTAIQELFIRNDNINPDMGMESVLRAAVEGKQHLAHNELLRDLEKAARGYQAAPAAPVVPPTANTQLPLMPQPAAGTLEAALEATLAAPVPPAPLSVPSTAPATLAMSTPPKPFAVQGGIDVSKPGAFTDARSIA